MKASKAQVIEIERYCDEHGISRQQRISELGLSPLIFLFLKCVIQLHYVYRPVSPVIEMTAPVDFSCVLESAFLHNTSGSEAYRKRSSASESSHGRRMSLSVSIMIQVVILILLAEVYILIQCSTADTGGL